MAKTLTAVAVEKLRPSPKRRREVPDGGGLYLVVQSSGHKSWVLRFRRPNGRQGKLTLGPLDLSRRESESGPIIGTPLTLRAARRLAADIQHQRALGRDVVADYDTSKRRQKSEQQARAASTFAAAARDFITGHAKKNTRNWEEQARLLGLRPDDLELIPGGLSEQWADKPIADIDGHDIHTVVNETRERGAPGLARHSKGPTESWARSMFTCISTMFNWLVQNRRLERSPVNGVHKPAAPKARDRVLTDDEILKFWRASDDTEIFGPLLKLLLLTGCRLNEVAGMQYSELSEDRATWVIPGTRTKNHRQHVVPLPPLLRELIPPNEEGLDLVFTTTGRTPVSGFGRIKRRLDKAMNVPGWRLHDLRRTFVTGMAEIGIAPHVIEFCVNHTSGSRGGIAGVYNRSELLPERKAAMERWAAHVAGLVEGKKASVVQLGGRKS
jgi:integrase